MKLEIYHWIIFGIIILGGLLASSWTAYQYIDGIKKDKKNDSISQELIKTQQSLITKQDIALNLSELAIKKQEETLELSLKLNKAQEEIVSLQNEMNNQIKGKGYPKMIFSQSGKQSLFAFIETSDNFVIKNIHVNILDAKKLLGYAKNHTQQIIVMKEDEFEKSVIYRSATKDDLSPKTANYLIPKINISNPDTLFLETRMLGPYIKVIQYSILMLKGNLLTHDYRIYELGGQNKLIENSNDNIPESFFLEHFAINKEIRFSN